MMVELLTWHRSLGRWTRTTGHYYSDISNGEISVILYIPRENHNVLCAEKEGFLAWRKELSG
jgi:hypothetical protein